MLYPIVTILLAIKFILVPTTNPECVIVSQITHSAGIFIVRTFFPLNNPVAFGRGGSYLRHNHFFIIVTTTGRSSTCRINVLNRLFTVVKRKISPLPMWVLRLHPPHNVSALLSFVPRKEKVIDSVIDLLILLLLC